MIELQERSIDQEIVAKGETEILVTDYTVHHPLPRCALLLSAVIKHMRLHVFEHTFVNMHACVSVLVCALDVSVASILRTRFLVTQLST